MTQVFVVGAGPVGLASALLLVAARGHAVTVFEAADEIRLSDENSYPIGVNPRGQEALRRIDPSLAERLRATGEVVAAWEIHAGRRTIARLPSGTVVATTRAQLTRILLDAAQADGRITVTTGHRLVDVDLGARELHFETSAGPVVVDASDARVLACDGVWSGARRAMERDLDGFRPRVEAWGLQFRVAFSRPGAAAPGLDPANHHIFSSKGIYTATLPDQRWCVVVTAIDDDPAAPMLLSDEASPANLAALREHLDAHAPLASPLLTDDDLAGFFGHKPFGGAVVRCDRLAVDEWLLLVGDAAHSVIPPTGEGVNSGLEGAYLLAETMASGSDTPFADFEAGRLPDLQPLGAYASHLRANIAERTPERSTTNVVLRIVGTVAARFGHRDSQVEQRLFGPDSGIGGYREVIGPWLAFQHRWTRRVQPVVHTASRLRRR